MGPCCVEGCEVTSEQTFYFEFPTSRVLRRKWLEVIPIPGKLPLGTVVCSRHFKTDDYESVRGKVRLKRKVVPSLRLDEKTTSKQSSPPPSSPSSPKSPASPPKPADTCDSTTVSVPSPMDAEKMIDDIQKEQRSGEAIPASGDITKPVMKENGRSCDGSQGIVKSPTPLPGPKEDIEDMITNYHIKNKVPNPALLADLVPAPSESESSVVPTQDVMESIEIEDVPEAAPVFIEISVDKETNTAGAGSQDCLMLLESVQVDIDPSTLLLAHDDDYYRERTPTPTPKPTPTPTPAPHKKTDPISLLTSSDEDDVIIQEPHIDTVEVSDETDEDDMPLVKLVKKKPTKKKAQKKKTKTKDLIQKFVWGSYDYYCVECRFTSMSRAEYERHITTHSTVLQVCPICDYTSASKHMFSKHVRLHKVEKRFKCHLCEYRARHKMSLIYHLKSHNSDGANFVDLTEMWCNKCGFKTDVKETLSEHVKLCDSRKLHKCDMCPYSTKKKSDLIRHKRRKHRMVSDNPELILD